MELSGIFEIMSATITALLGTALCQASQLAEMKEITSLLTRAAHGKALSISLQGGALLIDQNPVNLNWPGAEQIIATLRSCGIQHLTIPAGLLPDGWQTLANKLRGESDPGFVNLHNDLSASIPLIELRIGEVQVHQPISGEDIAQESLPIISVPLQLSVELSQLRQRGRAAIAAGNPTGLAEVLLRLAELKQNGAPGQTARIRGEREALISSVTLKWLLAAAAQPQTAPVIGNALISLGADISEPMLAEIGARKRPSEKETLISILTQVPDCQARVISALRSSALVIRQGAAVTAGRMRLAGAVPALAYLLRHTDSETRTVAWYALSEIGTPDAIAALNPERR